MKENDHRGHGIEILYKTYLLMLPLIILNNFLYRQYAGDENDKNKIFWGSRRY